MLGIHAELTRVPEWAGSQPAFVTYTAAVEEPGNETIPQITKSLHEYGIQFSECTSWKLPYAVKFCSGCISLYHSPLLMVLFSKIKTAKQTVLCTSVCCVDTVMITIIIKSKKVLRILDGNMNQSLGLCKMN